MTTHYRLGDGAPRDAVEDACRDLGFRLSNVVPRGPTHPAQMIFVSPDRLTLLHLVEDEVAGRALLLRGENAEELSQKLIGALGASIEEASK